MATLCIYGAGSIGCYLGGRLLAAGSDVTFIGRSRVGDELHQHGLALSSFHGKHGQVEPPNIRFSIDASAAATADLVLVTVKLRDMEFDFITPGLAGIFTLNLPDFAASLTGEDHVTI